MTQQIIDTGIQGNDGTGDSIRSSFNKVNQNFTELYAIFGGGTIKFTNLSDAPNKKTFNVTGYSTQYNVNNGAVNATFTGSLTGTYQSATLTITPGTLSGAVAAGQLLIWSSGPDRTVIVSGSGLTWTVQVAGSVATTSLNVSATVMNTAFANSAVITFANLEPNATQVDYSTVNACPFAKGQSITVNNLTANGSLVSALNGVQLVTGGTKTTVIFSANISQFSTVTATGTVSDINQYNPNQVIMADNAGQTLTARNVIGAGGIQVDTSSNYDLVIRSTVNGLIGDGNPKLSASINARNAFSIGNLPDPSENLVLAFNSLPGNAATPTTIDGLAISKGYADRHYIATQNGVIVNPLVPRQQPSTAQIASVGYDSTLTSNYLAVEAMQRKDVVYRGGDTMTGALNLSDHPAPMAGFGTPNGTGDLQSATKFYVDNSTYYSAVNLYVSTQGDDLQAKTPIGREGSAWQYAYRTLGAAALAADNLISLSSSEPGPYRQTITWTDTTTSTQTKSQIYSAPLSGGNSSNQYYQDAFDLLRANRSFIQYETIAYINKKYVNAFSYNKISYTNILSNIVAAVAQDLSLSSLDGSSLTTYNVTTQASLLYGASNSNIIINQLTQIVDAINNTKNQIVNYSYNTVPLEIYVGQLIDAMLYDLIFGSNYQSVQAALAYTYASTGVSISEIAGLLDSTTISMTALTSDGATVTLSFAQQVSAPYVVGSYIIVSDVYPTVYNGVYQVTGCTNTNLTYSNTSGLPYIQLGSIQKNNIISNMIDNTGISSPSITQTLISLANSISSIIKTGVVPTVVLPSNLTTSDGQTSAATLLFNNVNFIQSELIGFITSNFPTTTYDHASFQTDFKYAVYSLIYDMMYGGNSQTISTALKHWVPNAVLLSYPVTFWTSVYGYLDNLVQAIITNTINGQGVKINPIATSSITTSNGIVTITLASSAANSFIPGQFVTVAGITPSGYNGTYVVTNGTLNTVSYVNSTTGAQTVAGTVTGKPGVLYQQTVRQYTNLTLANGSSVAVTIKNNINTFLQILATSSLPASGIVSGSSYTILSVGNSNFTLNGAGSNAVGVSFIANSTAGTGSGTVYAIPTPITLASNPTAVTVGTATGNLNISVVYPTTYLASFSGQISQYTLSATTVTGLIAVGQILLGTGLANNTSITAVNNVQFTGYVAGNILTVVGTPIGTITIGMVITSPGVTFSNPIIGSGGGNTWNGTFGTTAGSSVTPITLTGVCYTVNIAQSLSSRAMTTGDVNRVARSTVELLNTASSSSPLGIQYIATQFVNTAYPVINNNSAINTTNILNTIGSLFNIITGLLTNGYNTRLLPSYNAANNITPGYLDYIHAQQAILANISFVCAETIAYMKLNANTLGYISTPALDSTLTTGLRYILEAIAYDITYASTAGSVNIANSFWNNGFSSISGLNLSTQSFYKGMLYAQSVVNAVTQSTDATAWAANNTPAQTTVVQVISSSWANVTNEAPRADITTLWTYIKDIISLNTYGNYTTGNGKLIYPVLTGVDSALTGTKRTIDNQNSAIVTATLLYLDTTYRGGFNYNESNRITELGRIIDGQAIDLVTGGNYQSVAAGKYYYQNANLKAVALGSQYIQTYDSIKFARDLALQVLNQVTATRFQQTYQQVSNATISSQSTNTITATAAGTTVSLGSTASYKQGTAIKTGNISTIGGLASNTVYYVTQFTSSSATVKLSASYANAIAGLAITFTAASYASNNTISILGNYNASTAVTTFTGNYNIVLNIISGGYGNAPTATFGTGIYTITFDNGATSPNGGKGFVDQGGNVTAGVQSGIHIIPGKILIGNTSGAVGQIVSYVSGFDIGTNYDLVTVRLIQPGFFQQNETMDFGETVSNLNITICIETGVYYEDYPIKVPPNVTIQGDDFRRVIIRPRDRISQSPYRNTFFYRDSVIDALQVGLINFGFDYATQAGTTATLSAINGVITIALANNVQALQSWVGNVFMDATGETGTAGKAVVLTVSGNIMNCQVIYPFASITTYAIGAWHLFSTINYGRHYLTDPLDINSVPLNNKDIDVFLVNDATRVRLVSAQGHGGFMMVLDPTGQIKTKSPYAQESGCFSGSLGTGRRFAGGQFIDGFTGRLSGVVTAIANLSVNGILYYGKQITVVGGFNSGLDLRAPQVPCAYYVAGNRYQINDVVSYTQTYDINGNVTQGTAVLTLDNSTPFYLTGIYNTYSSSLTTNLATLITYAAQDMAIKVTANFTGSIVGVTLTVSAVASGTLFVGMYITGPNIVSGTYISAYISGSATASGVWSVSYGYAVSTGSQSMVGNLYSNYKTVVGGGLYLQPQNSLSSLGQLMVQQALLQVQSQVSNLSLATASNAFAVNNSLGIMASIITNGVTSAPAAVFPGITLGNTTVRKAANIIQANKTFIQAEMASYITGTFPIQSYPGYNSLTTQQDAGYLVDAMTYDILYGGNSSTWDRTISYYTTNTSLTAAAFSASITGVTLAISGSITLSNGTGSSSISVGYILSGIGVATGTTIVSGSGNTWTVNISQTVSAGTIVYAGASNYQLTSNSLYSSAYNRLSTVLNQLITNNLVTASAGNPYTQVTTLPTSADAVFVGSISGLTLTVSSVTSGTIATNQVIVGSGIATNTYIVSGSGTTWTVSGSSQTVGAGTVISGTTVGYKISNGTTGSTAGLVDFLIGYVANPKTYSLPNRLNPTISNSDFTTITNAIGPIQTSTLSVLNSGANLTINIEMGGNKSMLANDFTNVNDLGYGIFATNSGLTEQVSTFTYYCYTAYWALNGGQIRSVAGSNANGQYGLRASGYDLTELPNQVSMAYDMVATAHVYKQGVYINKMLVGGLNVYISNYQYIPQNTSELEIDHTAAGGTITRYQIAIVSHTDVYYNGQNVLNITLASNGNDATATGGLTSALYNGQIMIIRVLQNFKLLNIANVKPVRPSTALQFTNDLSDIYRIINYNLTESTGEPFSLTSGTAVLAVDAGFNFYKLAVDNVNVFAGDPVNTAAVALVCNVLALPGGSLYTGQGNSTASTSLYVTNVSGIISAGQIVSGIGFGNQTVTLVTPPTTLYTLSASQLTNVNSAGLFTVTGGVGSAVVGSRIVITGTQAGSTAQLTPGSYYIISTNNSTSLTLSSSIGGTAYVPAVQGSMLGHNYTFTADSGIYVLTLSDRPSSTPVGPVGFSVKSQGATVGDNRVAITAISSVNQINQLNKGIWIFAWYGRTHRVISYTPPTFIATGFFGTGSTSTTTLTVIGVVGTIKQGQLVTGAGFNGTQYVALTPTITSVGGSINASITLSGVPSGQPSGTIVFGSVTNSYVTIDPNPLYNNSAIGTTVNAFQFAGQSTVKDSIGGVVGKIMTFNIPYTANSTAFNNSILPPVDSTLNLVGNANTGYNSSVQVSGITNQTTITVTSVTNLAVGMVVTTSTTGAVIASNTIIQSVNTTANSITVSPACWIPTGTVLNCISTTATVLALNPYLSVGSGYSLGLNNNPLVVFTDPNPLSIPIRQATAITTVNSNGTVNITITDVGLGYTVAPTVTFRAGSGALAGTGSLVSAPIVSLSAGAISTTAITGIISTQAQLLYLTDPGTNGTVSTTTNSSAALSASSIDSSGVLTVGTISSGTILAGMMLSGTGLAQSLTAPIMAIKNNLGSSVTLTIPTLATNPFYLGQIINVTGLTPAGLNGYYALSGSSATTFSASTGLISGTTMTLNGTLTDAANITVGATVTNANILSGTYITAINTATFVGTLGSTALTGSFSITNASGAFSLSSVPSVPLAVGQQITISTTGSLATTTNLSTVSATSIAGDFSVATSTLTVGQSVIISGTAQAVAYGNTFSLGSNGTFTLSVGATVTLLAGQPVTLTGSFLGGASITGFVSPQTYFIIGSPSQTVFQISATRGGSAVVGNSGTGNQTSLTISFAAMSITGYSPGSTYYIGTGGTTSFSLVSTFGGTAIANTVGHTTGLLFTVQPASISGYTTPTTYLIATVPTTQTFTLQTLTSSGISTIVGTLSGLTFTQLTNTLSVASVSSSTRLSIGMVITGTGVTSGTYITAFNSASGSAGTYTLNQFATGTPTTGTSYTINQSQTAASAGINGSVTTVNYANTTNSVVGFVSGAGSLVSNTYTYISSLISGGGGNGSTWQTATVNGSNYAVPSTAITATANLLTVSTTTNLIVGNAVTFGGNVTLGGLVGTATYYILSLANSTVTIGAAPAGAPTTVTSTSVTSGQSMTFNSASFVSGTTVGILGSSTPVVTSVIAQGITTYSVAFTITSSLSVVNGAYYLIAGNTNNLYNGWFPTTTATGTVAANGTITLTYQYSPNANSNTWGNTTGSTITSNSITATSSLLGLAKPFSTATSTTVRAGYAAGAGAQITVRISTCRATGHDFLDIGTGGYDTTNYPNQIYGSPLLPATAANAVVEEGVGRVFHVSTDQNGVFRVGRYFNVDQGTGTVTFSANIAISNLDGLGFKKGVVVSEFSIDQTMQANAPEKVPVESAVRGYIDLRLGLDASSNPVAAGSVIGPGYMPLNGGLAMKRPMNLGNNYIQNLTMPGFTTGDLFAANKGYVDVKTAGGNSLFKLLDIGIGASATFYSLSSRTLTVTGVQGLLLLGMVPYLSSYFTNNNYITNITVSDIYTVLTLNTAPATSPTGTPTITFNNLVAGDLLAYDTVQSVWKNLNLPTGDVNITYNATTSAGGTLTATIQANRIVDSMVNSSAAISQSKLNLQAAGSLASAPSVFTQSSLGLSAYNNKVFSTSNGWVDLVSSVSTTTGILYGKLQFMSPNTVIGNKTISAAAPTELAFSDIVTGGGGVFSANFTGAGVFTQTAQGTNYSITSVTTAHGNSSLIKSDANGLIDVVGIKIVGLPVISLNPDLVTLQFNTPSTGLSSPVNFLTAAGTTVSNTISTFTGTIDIATTNGTLLTRSLKTNATDPLVTGSVAGAWSFAGNSVWDVSAATLKSNSLTGVNTTSVAPAKITGYWALASSSTLDTSAGTLYALSLTSGIGTGSIKGTWNLDTGAVLDQSAGSIKQSVLTTGATATAGTVTGTWTVNASSSFTATSVQGQANSATIAATAANTASTIVQRDSSGNFTANSITASLNGNALTASTIASQANSATIAASSTNTASTIVQRNSSNNTELNALYAKSLIAGTIASNSGATTGQIQGTWTLTGSGSQLQATYSDLAEWYTSDEEYEPGTVLVFGGVAETTTTAQINDTRCAGVVTTDPAYTMNHDLVGTKVCIALVGRVPCKVVGRVKKGDMLTTSATPGYAVRASAPTLGAVIGKALEDKDSGEAGVIEIAVGRA